MRSAIQGAVLALTLFLAACGGPLSYQVASSPKAPGADATVDADISKDQHMTNLTVKAKNLPPPERVVEGTRIYIVWTRRGADQQWVRVGNLKYDADGREGNFQGTVPEIEFDMEITAEKDDAAASPAPDIIFSQHVGPG